MAGRNMVHKLRTWIIRAIHRKGFGVQSPWAYELVRDVFFEQLPYYAFEQLEKQAFFGKESKKKRHHSEQLFRIAHCMHPSSIVEVNDGCPMSMLYLASPHSDTPCTLITNSKLPPQFKKIFKGQIMAGNHLTTLQSLFPDNRSIAMLHIGDTNEAEKIYEWATEYADNSSIIILENLTKNALLWKKIVADERAIITFDFYEWGIIVFDKKRVKQNYLL